MKKTIQVDSKQVSDAIEPILFALEDIIQYSKKQQPSNDNEHWTWFQTLPTIFDKLQACAIYSSKFIETIQQLYEVENKRPNSGFIALTKEDLKVLSQLGDEKSKFTDRSYFSLQNSKLITQGLGIEMGFSLKLEGLEAGRILFHHLRRNGLDSNLITLDLNLLKDEKKLKRLLDQASFFHGFKGIKNWFDSTELFSLGEYISFEIENRVITSYNNRNSHNHNVYSEIKLAIQFWSNSSQEEKCKIILNGIRNGIKTLKNNGNEIERLQTLSTWMSQKFDSVPFFFPLQFGEKESCLEYLVSQEFILIWRENIRKEFFEEEKICKEKTVTTPKQKKKKKRSHSSQPILMRNVKYDENPVIRNDNQTILVKEEDVSSSDETCKEIIQEKDDDTKIGAPKSLIKENSEEDSTTLNSILESNRNQFDQVSSQLNVLMDMMLSFQTSFQSEITEMKHSISEIKKNQKQASLNLNVATSKTNNNVQTANTLPQTKQIPPTIPPRQTNHILRRASLSEAPLNRQTTKPYEYRQQYNYIHAPRATQLQHPTYVLPHEWHGPETLLFPSSPVFRQQPLASTPPNYTEPPELAQHFQTGLLPVDSICSSNLSEGITSFVEHCRVSKIKKSSSEQAVLESIRTVVESVWPRARVKGYGSTITGLSLPESDMDLVVCLPKVTVMRDAIAEEVGPLEGQTADERTSWQQKLSAALIHAPWVDSESLRTIQNAPMPVITLTTRGSPFFEVPIRLDISFQSESHHGLATNKLVNALQREHNMLRPLVLVLKQFLADRGLGKGFSGGLSSYALIIMCTCFLNTASRYLGFPTPDSNEEEGDEIGCLLVCFLRFFGECFDPRTMGISISRGFFQRHAMTYVVAAAGGGGEHQQQRRRSFRLEDITGHSYTNPIPQQDVVPPHKFDPLLIEDPLQVGNNVGRNVFRIHQIQRACADTAKQLRAANNAWSLGCVINSWRVLDRKRTSSHEQIS